MTSRLSTHPLMVLLAPRVEEAMSDRCWFDWRGTALALMASKRTTAVRARHPCLHSVALCLDAQLAWAQCQSGGFAGSNGGTIRFEPEINHGGNAGLKHAVALLKPIKDSNPGLSWADLMVYAGCIAIENMGGPVCGFRPGRSDAPKPNVSPAKDTRFSAPSRCEPGDMRVTSAVCAAPRVPLLTHVCLATKTRAQRPTTAFRTLRSARHTCVTSSTAWGSTIRRLFASRVRMPSAAATRIARASGVHGRTARMHSPTTTSSSCSKRCERALGRAPTRPTPWLPPTPSLPHDCVLWIPMG